jgi:DNA (cytosine-5)-methyltransferase 1
MKHIELFAGCGGLSLGFKDEGFELVLANELSPMAAETFAFNHLKEDLTKSGDLKKTKTFWISSQFSRKEVNKRLREEPLLQIEKKYKEVEETNAKNLLGSLTIGSIVDLNKILKQRDDLVQLLSKNLDVVSGGPPCQSFSMAGMRKKDCDKNSLPWEFANFVDLAKPKIALLENVTGILRPFTENGEQYHAWFEVAKAFVGVGYVPICLHINAKYVGAAQNRPRFVMIALRHDVADSKANVKDSSLKKALTHGLGFYKKVMDGLKVKVTELSVFDVENNKDFFKGNVFAPLYSRCDSLSSAKDAIGDLRGKRFNESPYVNEINSLKNEHRHAVDKLKNHELRSNNFLVQSRFRLYQIMNTLDKKQRRELTIFLKDPESESLSKETKNSLLRQKYLDPLGQLTELESIKDLLAYLKNLKTKKQTQKALLPDLPAPAALSIPDDACHWDENHPRTLSVREMARIQSFPDWFEFRSKVTTGGKMRRFEVPQYTQVGNAVPPLLGKALAKCVKSILMQS